MSGFVSLLEGERKKKKWVGVDGAHLPLSAYIMVAIGTAAHFPNLAPVYSHTCRQLDMHAHRFTEERQIQTRTMFYQMPTVANIVWLAFLEHHVFFINTEGPVQPVPIFL